MDLATMLAQGATAEGLVRAMVEHFDQEWVDGFNVYTDPNATDLARERAYGKLLAVHAPRAVLTAAVELWDAERVASTEPVHVGERRLS